MKVAIKVFPNSKKESVVKIEDGSLEVRVKSQAKDGKANKDVINILSKYFNVPKSCISIKVGMSSKFKVIQINK